MHRCWAGRALHVGHRPALLRGGAAGWGAGEEEEGSGLLEPRAAGGRGQEFVSAVCWRPGTRTLVAASSQGAIKLMALTDDGGGGEPAGG